MTDRPESSDRGRRGATTLAEHATRLATLLAIGVALGVVLGRYGARVGLTPMAGGVVMGLVTGIFSIALFSPRAPARTRARQALCLLIAGTVFLAVGGRPLAQLPGVGLGFVAVSVGLLVMAATGVAAGRGREPSRWNGHS